MVPYKRMSAEASPEPNPKQVSLPPDGAHSSLPSRSLTEFILLGLLVLILIASPSLMGLDRIADWFLGREPTVWGFSFWHKLGSGLKYLLPKDLSWAAPLVQHATLWIGLFGAVVAVGVGRHVGVSLTQWIPSTRWRRVAESYSTLVFVTICILLAHTSVFNLITSVSSGSSFRTPGTYHFWLTWPEWKELFHVLSKPHQTALPIPDAIIECIMPIAFALMALRMAFRMFARSPGSRSSALGNGARWLFRGLVVILLLVALYLGLDGIDFHAEHIHWVRNGKDWKPLQVLFVWIMAHEKIVLWTGVVVVASAFFLGMPIFLAVAGVTLLLLVTNGVPIASIPGELNRLLRIETLSLVPLLTLIGYLLTTGRGAERLVRLYKSLFGWLPGGVALMAISICVVFTTLTGGSGVTIIALGGLMVPILLKEGYPAPFSYGLVTAAGSLGLLFPPSITVQLYTYAVNPIGSGSASPETTFSMKQLYLGGLIPGLLMVILIMAYGMYVGIRKKVPRQRFNLAEFLSAAWDAKWDLLLPVIILVPYMLGAARTLEAAALGVVYTSFVGLVIHRDIHPLRDYPIALVQCAILVSTVVLVLGMALALSNFLVLEELPTQIIDWVTTNFKSKWTFLLALNVILLVLGSILEIYSAIIILAPLLAPLAAKYHINPVHLGVVFLSNMELGFLLPPIGLNLLLAGNRFRKPLYTMYRDTGPFLIVMTVGVIIITYIEPATTWVLRFVNP